MSVSSGDVSVHAILDRSRPQPLRVVSAQDFHLGPAEAADIAEALANPSCLPYCVDSEFAAMLLVEMPEGVDIENAPFLYAEQHRLARRVFRVPLDMLTRYCLALPDPERLLLIHSTGRCGSTLLTAALAELPEVRTLSEPDVFTQGAMTGPVHEQRTRATLAGVYRACLRLLCRASAPLHVIKLRSVAIEHADMIGAGMSGIRRLFLYRDAVAVAASTARILGRDPDDWILTAQELRSWRPLAPLLPCGDEGASVDAYTLYAALWAGPVAAFLRASATQNGWIGSLRYEDLCEDPPGALRALLLRCDAAVRFPTDLPTAFNRDAQRGSMLDRERVEASASERLRARVSGPAFAAAVVTALRRLAPDLPIDAPLPDRLCAAAD
ncbi:MAG: hypothetical protein E6Q88_01505 [Lysobacteraceae bacterium]|nr:MAG: hypothetical protein E6Q88_01505 [Xanthomonadaceae bacterium]